MTIAAGAILALGLVWAPAADAASATIEAVYLDEAQQPWNKPENQMTRFRQLSSYVGGFTDADNDLTTLGQTDWVYWEWEDVDDGSDTTLVAMIRKAGGAGIGPLTSNYPASSKAGKIGPGGTTLGGAKLDFSDGTTSPSGTDVDAGAGLKGRQYGPYNQFEFTVPVTTSTSTLYVWWSGLTAKPVLDIRDPDGNVLDSVQVVRTGNTEAFAGIHKIVYSADQPGMGTVRMTGALQGQGQGWSRSFIHAAALTTEEPAAVIPEPLTMLAVVGGLGAVGAYVRRRRS
jgi:hypothetical protein